MSFSQQNTEDLEGLLLLEDSDDTQIKFENHYFESLKYKAIGNYSRAITELEICQELYPDNTSVDFEFSKNYFFLERFNEAELYINKVLKLEPMNYWFIDFAKNIYEKQFNYSKAIEFQKKLVEQNPKVTEELVRLFMYANRKEEAKILIDKLEADGITSSRLRRYKDSIEKYNKPTIKIQEVESDLTLEDLKKSYEEEKKFDVLIQILEEELVSENYENLKVYSEEGLELFPAQPMVYIMNSKSLVYQKKYNEAIDVLNTGIDFVIDNVMLEAEFYEQLGVCHIALNNPKEAEKNRQKALELRRLNNQ
ncbi:hypothetical protein LPB138_11075 [Urechidicola croceus]|uniref:Tetratricopeptide repeat protein n=1 Tax=Urechidicola croceus TaxID=1850246 RepID=A0A1D8P9F2_9FLAO|nr:hypothetical protein LPB138_11075 [Urechidicola croceus]